ncbi:MAG: HAD-IIB family hydrolase [Pseudomonadota bacterium]
MRGVFTDIDDTLTTDGRVSADVFSAMERLQAAGLLCVPITGRPAGWCDLIARQWPVDAVVGENGAFYFRYDQDARQMIRVFVDDAEARARNTKRLQVIRDEVLAEVPGAAVSADQAFRISDLAIDFCEDVAPLGEQDIAGIVEVFTRHGATAKVSSIHVNGWFGDFDKLTMTRQLMSEQFAVNLEKEVQDFTFVGDSPNDAPMFRYFPKAVGVANLRDLLDLCDASPAWITAQPRGGGFVELVDRVLSLR